MKDKFLIHHWFPEQIAGRLRQEDSTYHISYNTIYRAIYSGVFDTAERRKSQGNRGAKHKLRHRGKPRHGRGYQERRGKVEVPHCITQRSEPANARTRWGDWEADTVIGKLGKACLLTIVDRTSRYLICRKLKRKGSEEAAREMVSGLRG